MNREERRRSDGGRSSNIKHLMLLNAGTFFFFSVEGLTLCHVLGSISQQTHRLPTLPLAPLELALRLPFAAAWPRTPGAPVAASEWLMEGPRVDGRSCRGADRGDHSEFGGDARGSRALLLEPSFAPAVCVQVVWCVYTGQLSGCVSRVCVFILHCRPITSGRAAQSAVHY